MATTETYKASTEETPWYSKYPVARTQIPASISREYLLNMIKSGKDDFILIDLRRTDHEVPNHLNSLFIPEQLIMEEIGRNHTWIDQSPGAKLVHIITNFIRSSQGSRSAQGHLVLW